MKFKLGDRVKAKKPVGSANMVGVFGTVKHINTDSEERYGVEFETNIDGHSLLLIPGGCRSGYGWYCSESDIELFKSSNKFKVGDYIIGNDEASKEYLLTVKGWIGKVKAIDKRGTLTVISVSDRREYNLDPKCFDKYNPYTHDLKKDAPSRISLRTGSLTVESMEELYERTMKDLDKTFATPYTPEITGMWTWSTTTDTKIKISPTKGGIKTIMKSLLTKLMDKDLALLQQYVFDCGDLEVDHPLVAEALLTWDTKTTPLFKDQLVAVVKKHDKDLKKKDKEE